MRFQKLEQLGTQSLGFLGGALALVRGLVLGCFQPPRQHRQRLFLLDGALDEPDEDAKGGYQQPFHGKGPATLPHVDTVSVAVIRLSEAVA